MIRLSALLTVLFSALTLFAGARARPLAASIASTPVETAPTEHFRLAGRLDGDLRAVAGAGEMLVVAAGDSLLAVDTSNRNRIHAAGEPLPLGGQLYDVAVYGETVYAARLYDGVAIASLGAGGTLEAVGALDGLYARELIVDGDRLYVRYTDTVVMFNLASATLPVEEARFTIPWDAPLAVAGGYAYVVDGEELVIVATAAAEGPREVSRIEVGAVEAFDVVGDLAYLATNAEALQVVDASDPAAPTLRGAVALPYLARDIAVVGDHAYLLTFDIIYSADVADPDQPALAGRYLGFGMSALERVGAPPADAPPAGALVALDYSHSLLTLFDIAAPAFPKPQSSLIRPAVPEKALLHGERLYLAQDTGGLLILDLAAPAPPGLLVQPRVLAHYRSPRLMRTASGAYVWAGSTRGLDVAGDFAYLANSSGGLHIVDISRPEALRLAGVFVRRQPQPIYPQDVAVRAGLAYVAHQHGLLVLDVANPAAPTELAAFPTTMDASLSRVTLGGDYAVVSGPDGADVYSLADPRLPILTAEIRDVVQAVALQLPFLYVATPSGLQIWQIDGGGALSEVAHLAGLNVGAMHLAGMRLYVSERWGEALRVLDISEPAAPRFIATEVDAAGTGAVVGVDDEFLYLVGQDVAVLERRVGVVGIVDGGGTFTVPGGGVTYHFAPDVFVTPTEVHHRVAPKDVPPLPADVVPIGGAFEVQAFAGEPVEPARPYTLTLALPADLAPESAEALALYRLHEGQWAPVAPAVVAAVGDGAQQAAATLEQLGLFRLTAPAGHHVHLPGVMRETARVADLALSGIEVTQGMQNSANNLPLVAGRTTVARVFGQVSGYGQPLDDVTLTLHGFRDGRPLPGSPLTAGPRAIFERVERQTERTSFDVRLPAGWAEGELTLTAELAPRAPFPEVDWQNNHRSVTVSFAPLPPLRVVIVPVDYTTNQGVHCPAPEPVDIYGAALLRDFPVADVELSFRAPIQFSGDLRYDNWSLLKQITSVKEADDAPAAVVYYGAFTSTNDDGERCPYGYHGMGWIGTRAGYGLRYSSADTVAARDRTAGLAAHEIGHNFGLRHAPCPGTSPAGVNTNYPYPDGSIGEIGYDILRGWVRNPAFPAFAKDAMTYCAAEGFSDYHYRMLFADQQANGAITPTLRAPAPYLHVRATLGEGDAVLHPTYVLPRTTATAPARFAPGSYQVELVDAAGARLALHPVTPVRDGHDHGEQAAVFATLPLPEGTPAEVRLLEGRAVIARRALAAPDVGAPAAPDPPPTLTPTASGALLRWGPTASPVLVRYTADDGATWTTLALDVMGGELSLDHSQLPAGGDNPVRLEIRPADTGGPVTWGVVVGAADPQ